MIAAWLVVPQVLASTRAQQENAILLGIAAVALLASIACIVFGVRLVRQKQVGLAVAVFLVGGLALFTCLGLSALTFIAQFAWH